MEENSEHPTRSECPFLGSARDPTVNYAYPSHRNICYAQQTTTRRRWFRFRKVAPYAHIPLERQKHRCLVEDKWQECPHRPPGDEEQDRRTSDGGT